MRKALYTALGVSLTALVLLVVQLRLGWSGGGLGLRLAPYQAPVLAFGSELGAGFTSLFQSDLARENDRLRQRVLELEADGVRSRAIDDENQRLTALLELKQDQLPEGIAARVAARDPSSWFAEMVVDKGSADGVTRDMVAVVPQGLVGRVVATSEHSARVRFLLDPQIAVPVMLEKSHAVGILYGESGYNCTLRFLDHSVEVKEGELVLTSGLGDVYPRGLVVGRVVRNYGRTEALFQSVQVRPAAEFGRLHEVVLGAKRS